MSIKPMVVTSDRVRSPLDRTTIGAGNNSVGLTSKVHASKGQPQRHPGREDVPTPRAPKNCNIGDKASCSTSKPTLCGYSNCWCNGKSQVTGIERPMGSGRYEVVCELTDACPKCKSLNINAEVETENQLEGAIVTSGISYECADCGAMFSKPFKISPVILQISQESGET